MIDINDHIELPFELKISFDKLLRHYESLIKNKDPFFVEKANRILELQKPHPILRDGFSEVKYLDIYKEEIHAILQDSFSGILTNNEIKTATVPFHQLIFNASERFKNIIKNAGKDF